MSKAYDSVHIPLLKNALHRIKVPSPLVSLIANIFTNWTNSVITNLGNTELYQVYDGIDQGETITPLLWRIYYDLLLSKITKQHKGYIIDYTHNLLASYQTTQIQVLAYIDDTL